MPTYCSPTGNPEVWDEKPTGYFTVDEWKAAHPTPVYEPTEKENQLYIYRNELSTYEQYLTSTDWYIVRFMDNGVSVPDDVKAKRQEAREAIDRLRVLIAEIEEVA